MANYGHITRNTDPEFATGGYKNVFYFAPKADFLSLKGPITPVVNLGDAVTISAAHTFTAPKGFFTYACKTDSVTLKGTTVGEDGALEMEWSAEFTILGDSASTQEQVQRQLNDDLIALLKDADCATNQYVQLGNDCVSPKFKAEYDGKTTKEGKKEYKITVTCKKKYFYAYTVTESAA